MKPPKIHVSNRGTTRKPNYWLRYSVEGEDIREPTGAATRPEANAIAEAMARKFVTGAWLHPKERAHKSENTFEVYAPIVIARRVARGVKTAAKDERGHVENHLVPMFTGLRMEELTFKVIRDKFRELEAAGLAGRTVRNVHATLRGVLLEAVEDELLVHLPPPLTARRGHLPPPVDKDPAWRDTAVFSRDELSALLSRDEIEPQYRAMYATWLLTGSRFSELLPVRLGDYDRARRPLAAISLPAAKTRRDKGQLYRVVPVHPELRPWLEWWIDTGYAMQHGNPLAAGALLFPTASRARQKRAEPMCSHGEVYKRWQRYHLPWAGLKHRRLHDARRTFVSIARSSGAPADIVRAITHKVTADKVIDAYTSWEWDALCKAIAAVQWRIPGPPGEVGSVVRIGARRLR